MSKHTCFLALDEDFGNPHVYVLGYDLRNGKNVMVLVLKWEPMLIYEKYFSLKL
jgi:hypothetical protein